MLQLSGARAATLDEHEVPRGWPDEVPQTADIITLARQYGPYGYRKIAELPDQGGSARE